MENVSIIRSRVIISDEKIYNYSHRYLLERIWYDRKPIATVVMLNPSYANEVKWDYSSMRVMNFLIDQGYGGVTIVNLFSCIETNSEDLPSYNIRYNKDTDKYIAEAITQNKAIILAWGSNKDRIIRIKALVKILQSQKEKKQIYRLTDNDYSIKHVSVLKKELRLEPLQNVCDIFNAKLNN